MHKLKLKKSADIIIQIRAGVFTQISQILIYLVSHLTYSSKNNSHENYTIILIVTKS